MSTKKVVPAAKKVAAKKVAKVAKVKEPRTVRIPEIGWGFTPETLKKIETFCKKDGTMFTLSDFLRAAVKKAYGISND